MTSLANIDPFLLNMSLATNPTRNPVTSQNEQGVDGNSILGAQSSTLPPPESPTHVDAPSAPPGTNQTDSRVNNDSEPHVVDNAKTHDALAWADRFILETRRRGGRQTENSVLKQWKSWASQAINSGKLPDIIVDANHTIEYLKYAATRELFNTRGQKKVSTNRLSASSLKKIMTMLGRVRRRQEDENQEIRISRPAKTSRTEDFYKAVMVQAQRLRLEYVKAVAKRARERTLTSYTLLLRLVPQLKKVIEDPDMESLNTFLAALQDGANGARADDIKRIKEEIGNWINLDYKPPVPLNPKCREGRGLAHDLCGELLSPIEFNWQDLEVRANIRNQKDGYAINNNYFLRCLYPKGRYDPKLVERNFLRSRLLVQVYCSIFTSPSSADGLEDLDESVDRPARKKKKTSGQKNATKTNVATLLNMDGRVSSRSIAYAAVLLVFNLTDATQWVEVYNGFNFVMFYNFLVDYLEVFRNDAKKNRVEGLLAWWNSNVFPHHVATAPESNESQDLLAAQEDRADLELL
ncbi:hypothetical protein GALMADRAFT_283872 [Galerina marginata CBS 339.88]|uniref:Uncharacterized protein n=1 Tax=Galerina marginata (strain CBS 339.88) TaxID=685588 RepID=A0A067SFG0_GALM3|nr:hypothetical protein GALMADRAFT_283872 [Galerina marginata CBS 339.88]